MESMPVPEPGLRSETRSIFMNPVRGILPDVPLPGSRGEKPPGIASEHQLTAPIYYHPEEHESLRSLIQVLHEDGSAGQNTAPVGGIGRSGLSGAIGHRGPAQLQSVSERPGLLSGGIIPKQYAGPGDTVLTDGALTDALLSMYRADYRGDSRKAEAHSGFSPDTGIH